MMQYDNCGPSATRVDGLPSDGELALAVLDALHPRMCVIDEGGHILFANKVWREFSTSSCEKAIHTDKCRQCPASLEFTSSLMRNPENPIQQDMQKLLAKECVSFSFEYECHSDGCSRWFISRVSRLPGNNPGRLLIVHEDITERRRTEETLHRTAKQLKQLGAHMEKVREEQSAMIARELHDELGALLTMFKLDLTITAEKVTAPQSLRAKFSELVGQIQTALDVVKRISTNLRPAMLDTLGLMATIRWYVQQFSNTTGIITELQMPDYVRLSDVSSIAVFRIIQEGLTNIATHAAATRASIQVCKEAGSLIVAISDNGQGMQTDVQHKSGSFGLIGMQERAHYLGGCLDVQSQPGHGTTLTLKIPLDSQSTHSGESTHPRRRAQDWLQGETERKAHD